MPNATSPFHGAPSAFEIAARLASRSATSTWSHSKSVDVREVDVRAALLGGPDLARDVLGEQVVDRDRVLVAVEVDDQPSTSRSEHQGRPDGRERAGHGGRP